MIKLHCNSIVKLKLSSLKWACDGTLSSPKNLSELDDQQETNDMHHFNDTVKYWHDTGRENFQSTIATSAKACVNAFTTKNYYKREGSAKTVVWLVDDVFKPSWSNKRK